MGLHRFKPPMSGRMGIFWTLAGIREAAVVEFGCMGHNLYGRSALRRAGIHEGYGANLYTTYVDETDIALGETRRLYDTIKHVIETDRPKVIFLQPSAVPEVIGTDLAAAANVMRPDFPGVKIIPVGRGSFAISRHRGVLEALLAIAENIPEDINKIEERAFNVIGSCPDLLRFGADAGEIARAMSGAFGMEPLCALSAGTDVTSIKKMGAARVNLVIRREGVPAAEALKKRFGTPFCFGRPYGIEGTAKWLYEVGVALGAEPDENFIASEKKIALTQIKHAYEYLENSEWSYPEEAVLSIGGHYDTVNGISEFAVSELPIRAGVRWCDCPEHADGMIPYFTEREWIPVVENHEKGYLMFTGEALKWAGKNTELMTENPDVGWRLHPYEPPFTGFRGAVNIVSLLMDEYARTH